MANFTTFFPAASAVLSQQIIDIGDASAGEVTILNDFSVDGNTVIGSGSGDSLTVNAGTVTFPNIADGIFKANGVLGLNAMNQLVSNGIVTAQIDDSAVTTAKIADANVTTAKLADDAVTGAKIADDAIDSNHYADGSIDTAHIGDDQITAAKIAADAVTQEQIHANVAGAGLSQASTGALDVNVGATTGTVTARGLNINNSDVLGVLTGTGLEINTTTGALQVSTLSLNNTFFATSTVATAADITTAIAATEVVADNASGMLERGDLVLVAAADGGIETFLYVGADTIDLSSGTVNAANLRDITFSGNTVSSITAGSGLTGTATSGAVTVNVGAGTGITVAADTVGIADSGVGTTQLADDAVTNAKLASDSVDSDQYVNGSIDLVHLGTDVTAAVADAGTALATGDQIHTFVTGLTSGTENTVTKFGTGGDLVDSNITDDGTTVVVGGTTLDVNAAVDIDGATFALDTTGTTATSIDINSGGGIDVDASGSIAIESSSTGANAIRLATTMANTVANNIDINSAGGIDIDAGSAGITMSTTGNGDVSVEAGGTGNLTLSGATGELRIAGAGINTATDLEPLNLVVGANGQVMTSTIGDSGFKFVGLNSDGSAAISAAITANAGDLAVLHNLGTGSVSLDRRTLTIPSNPNRGDSIKVANLSTTGAGSGTNRWVIRTGTTGTFTVHGTTIQNTAGFVLDDNTASFEFVYTGTNYGWVIIGAN